MRWLLDIAYLATAVLTMPLWLPRMVATGKIRTDWSGRFGRVRETVADDGRPRILIHAVSVGEVNATRELVALLEQDDRRPHVIVATTTDTGHARAKAIYGDRHTVVRYPFDLSFAVSRFLDRVRPDVVALVELEVWPNFTAACQRRGVPIGVVNGRLSARSFARYRRVRRLVRPSFSRLAFAGVQDQAYAERFAAMGVARDRVVVTDTMKWDTAKIDDHVPGANELAEAMGIDRGLPLVVAGSTAPEEHSLLHEAVSDRAQLLCAPRKPEWFDDAASALPGCARRSRGDSGSETGRFLLDSMGELRVAYALADVVVVGRTFAPYGGSDMMEPVGLGKAAIVGPDVTNFGDTAKALVEGNGLIQTTTRELPEVLRELLADPDRRRDLARRGREIILSRQGASRRSVELILGAMDTSS